MLALLLFALLAAPAETDIRGILVKQQADWNSGNVESFMVAYDTDATFMGKAGVTRGYQAVLERYRKSYPTKEKMGTLTFSELEIRVLDGNAAIVLGKFALQRSAEAGGDAQGRFTLIWRKTAKGWKIIHDHTS